MLQRRPAIVKLKVDGHKAEDAHTVAIFKRRRPGGFLVWWSLKDIYDNFDLQSHKGQRVTQHVCSYRSHRAYTRECKSAELWRPKVATSIAPCAWVWMRDAKYMRKRRWVIVRLPLSVDRRWQEKVGELPLRHHGH